MPEIQDSRSLPPDLRCINCRCAVAYFRTPDSFVALMPFRIYADKQERAVIACSWCWDGAKNHLPGLTLKTVCFTGTGRIYYVG